MDYFIDYYKNNQTRCNYSNVCGCSGLVILVFVSLVVFNLFIYKWRQLLKNNLISDL